MKTKLDQKVILQAAGITAAVSLVLGVLGLVPLLNCLLLPITCLVGFGLPIFVGWWVVSKHHVNKDNLVDGLLIGAIGGLAAGVAAGVISFVISLIGNLLGFAAGSALSGLGGDSDYAASAALSGGFSVIASIIGSVITVFSYAIVSAITGLIVAALNNKGATVTPAK